MGTEEHSVSGSEFEAQMRTVEDRLDKAERLLDAANRLVELIDLAHQRKEGRRRRPLALVVVGTALIISVAYLARRLQSS